MGSMPRLGALGHAFTASRAMQFISLVGIIGMTADFIAEIVGAEAKPPDVLIGTLVVAVIAALYVVISYILYWDAMLPLLIATAADAALLVAVIVVAVVMGKPLSYLTCSDLPRRDGGLPSFIASVGENILSTTDRSGIVRYYVWVGAARQTCYAIKAVWGLSIALCILFAVSSITSACLWRRLKMGPVPGKDVEGQ
ncbi:hypothetical protein SODALDRAFT_275226 [Sodiomyces alkalinus F11]|uniref:MARVEL domain-containing protein n=1 Tax=Sodiomyces alkalinus (strain CBS 110278 / VKM F-3762 / F11) TaxID=1314773 RepID=A0A3N2PYJ7_SODAK|nr:hypothetical protein SODALDRAFT_275226 [Sodiomyces alkalinus F11]ROT39496.1 hypothetical protein SODALDRAFT_275226 [Sodiomyces alkalinus F11]